MKAALDWIVNNKTRAAGIASVLIGWLALVVPEGITTGLNQLLGIALGTVVWNTVTPYVKPEKPSEPAPQPPTA